MARFRLDPREATRRTLEEPVMNLCRLRRAMKLLSRTDRSIVDIALGPRLRLPEPLHDDVSQARRHHAGRVSFERDGEQLDRGARRSLRQARA